VSSKIDQTQKDLHCHVSSHCVFLVEKTRAENRKKAFREKEEDHGKG
jgi:hypothetical protein